MPLPSSFPRVQALVLTINMNCQRDLLTATNLIWEAPRYETKASSAVCTCKGPAGTPKVRPHPSTGTSVSGGIRHGMAPPEANASSATAQWHAITVTVKAFPAMDFNRHGSAYRHPGRLDGTCTPWSCKASPALANRICAFSQSFPRGRTQGATAQPQAMMRSPGTPGKRPRKHVV